jgi:hypothetical protein
MPKVFISHSSHDRPFVEREVIALLKRHGIETWYSRDDIRATSDWEQSIRGALSACDWFLIVLSPESVQSEWVRSPFHNFAYPLFCPSALHPGWIMVVT